MNITKENINELNAIITVKIEKSDYEATVNEQFDSANHYADSFSLPTTETMITQLWHQSDYPETVREICRCSANCNCQYYFE